MQTVKTGYLPKSVINLRLTPEKVAEIKKAAFKDEITNGLGYKRRGVVTEFVMKAVNEKISRMAA